MSKFNEVDRQNLADAFKNILMDEDTECGNEILCTVIAERLVDAVETFKQNKNDNQG